MEYDAEYKEMKLVCPKCLQTKNKSLEMKKIVKGGVVIDVCQICGGIWLDKDEITNIILHVVKGNDKKQLSNEVGPVVKNDNLRI